MSNDIVKKIITDNKYLTLSTVNGDRSPHASPVFFVERNGNFYWWSAKNSQHSKNVSRDGRVFITIFNSTVKEADARGVYIDAKVKEINEGHTDILSAYNDKAEAFKLATEDVSGDSPSRLYEATPLRCWINGDTTIDGHYVDIREEMK